MAEFDVNGNSIQYPLINNEPQAQATLSNESAVKPAIKQDAAQLHAQQILLLQQRVEEEKQRNEALERVEIEIPQAASGEETESEDDKDVSPIAKQIEIAEAKAELKAELARIDGIIRKCRTNCCLALNAILDCKADNQQKLRHNDEVISWCSDTIMKLANKEISESEAQEWGYSGIKGCKSAMFVLFIQLRHDKMKYQEQDKKFENMVADWKSELNTEWSLPKMEAIVENWQIVWEYVNAE